MSKVQKKGPKKITVLYPLPNTAKQDEKSKEKKLRVAAYCRVSSSSEEQRLSFNTQIKYYEKHISDNPEYAFVGIYADEGISGTSLRKRDAFRRMMQDSREGLIDMIITKSVSRFGRNTLDTLNSIRELKSMGVDVYFEKENIQTSTSEGEILLTLISAVAENESYTLSQNIKWGKRRRYEKGDICSIPWKNITGFDKDENGNTVINEEQAATVRRIFKEFLDGQRICRIARHLNEERVPLVLGGKTWTVRHIKSILTNEKYKGDTRFQKRYTNNPLTKHRLENKGELPQYYCENSHVAIIDRSVWNCVQLELERQQSFSQKHHPKSKVNTPFYEDFPLSGKIVCRCCGNMLKIKVSNKLVDKGTKFYICSEYRSGYRRTPKPGICSNGNRINPEIIKRVYLDAWNTLIDKRNSYLDQWEKAIKEGSELERYRAKELIQLTTEIGRIKSFQNDLMLKTFDHIVVGNDGLAEVNFLAGTKVEVRF